MAAFSFNKLVIFGVGLIGGSLARALRERAGAGATGEVVGVGRSIKSVEHALELGLIDSAVFLDDDRALELALRDADFVLVAAPVAQTEPLLRRIVPFLDARTILTDVGSTKNDVVAAARAALGDRDRVGQFVPGHPITGRESSGPDAAIPDLYIDRNVVLCPLPENPPEVVERVAAMWLATGASMHRMTAEQHDSVLASVSHLPHVLSFALVEMILQAPDAALKFSFAAGGFRDFTRIAASSPEMWRDACIANRAALLTEIDAYINVLARFRQAIETSDGAALEAAFERSRTARTEWQHGGAIKAAAESAQ